MISVQRTRYVKLLIYLFFGFILLCFGLDLMADGKEQETTLQSCKYSWPADNGFHSIEVFRSGMSYLTYSVHPQLKPVVENWEKSIKIDQSINKSLFEILTSTKIKSFQCVERAFIPGELISSVQLLDESDHIILACSFTEIPSELRDATEKLKSIFKQYKNSN